MQILEFINSLKSRDAALVYFWLREKTGGVGRLEGTSLERIATGLTVDKLTTSRGANFTAAVVRSKLKELETVGVVDREDADGATFNLYVYNPIPLPMGDEIAPEPEPEPVDLYDGRTLFDFHYENENENENEIEKEKEPRINREILINKKINNPKGEDQEEPEPQPSTTPEPKSDAPTPDDAVSRIDWRREDVQRLRDELTAIVWEPDINPAIIDRLTATCVLGVAGVDRRRVFRIARDAARQRELYVASDGRAGKSHAWKALGYSVKRVYDAAGYAWTPTKPGIEPAPGRRGAGMTEQTPTQTPTQDDDACFYRDKNGYLVYAR